MNHPIVIYVVRGLKKPLLGRPAIETLGVAVQVDQVHRKCSIMEEYYTLF